MYCSNCGKKRVESDNFCSSCGTAIGTSVDSTPSYFQGERRKPKPLLWSSALLLLLLGGMGAWATVNGVSFLSTQVPEVEASVSSPVSDEELDRDSFRECVSQTDLLVSLNALESIAEDLKAEQGSINGAIFTDSQGDFEALINNLPSYSAPLNTASDSFRDVGHCGSTSFRSYLNDLRDISSVIASDLAQVTMFDFGPYERVTSNRITLAKEISNIRIWLRINGVES